MDWEDDLLALAGEPVGPKAGKNKAESAKKRKRSKRASESESDMDMSDGSNAAREADAAGESDDEDFSERTNKYPLEGKYVDAADKAQLMRMSEIDRESLIAARLDDMQRLKDMDQVRRMAKGVSGEKSTRTSARDRKTTGKSDKRTSKLGELERKRESKKRKAEKRDDSDGEPSKQRDSWSPEDDSEPEEGEFDDYGDKAKTKRGRSKKGKAEVIEERMGEAELRNIFIPRHELIKYWSYPWFESFVTGAWVRFLAGQDMNDPLRPNVYRICEVVRVSDQKTTQPYRLENDDYCNMKLEIRHGADTALVRVGDFSNGVSNGVEKQPFTKKEYLRIINICQEQNIPLPSMKDAQKKSQEMRERRKAPKTDLDETIALRTRRALDPKAAKMNSAQIHMTKTQLTTARRSNNEAEIKRLEELLTTAGVALPSLNGEDSANKAAATPVKVDVPSPAKGSLASVNQRNRRANRMEIRKAEMAAQSQRKTLEQMGKADPSARVKTMVRIMHDVRENTPESGANTPAHNGSISPTKTSTEGSTVKALATSAKWEETAKSVVVDLDF